MDAYIITQDDFKTLENEWGQLLEACAKDNFFLSWKWLSVWWHLYGFDLEWLLIGVRDGEQLIGIADESNRFEVFNELKNLHNLRWQAKGMSGFFCDDTACSFHDEVIRQVPPENTELSYIKDRNTGAYLAIHYSFIWKQKVFLYQQGTNLDYHRYSPGIVLLVYNIKRYIKKGFEELDFMRGDEEYKFHWTRDCRPNIQIILFNHRKIKTWLLKKLYLFISN